MRQVSLGLNLSTKKTRKREFLEQMNKVVPWDVLVGRGRAALSQVQDWPPSLCH
jgi:hypothetical protein